MGLQNFYRPTRFASGLLMWTHGTQHHIWDRFQQDPQGAINSTTDGDQVLANIVVSNLDTKFEEAFLTPNADDSSRWDAKVSGDLPTPIEASFRSFVAHKEKEGVYWAVPA